MSGGLVPAPKRGELVPTVGFSTTARASDDWRTSRALARIDSHTAVRAASVQSHAIVQNEKLCEIDRLAREAMSGQAMLQRWAATLGQGDPFVVDELKTFTDLAKIGKAQILTETMEDFSQEGRR
jgi:hypothetical protein